MDRGLLSDIILSPLKRIPVAGGDVLHVFKNTDSDFTHFGEAYFSFVEQGVVKAWKLHKRMTLNLVVPIGDVRFIFTSNEEGGVREATIGESNYARLTVPPGIWFGFQGLAKGSNLLLNLADITHDPDEVLRKSIDEFKHKF